MSEDQVKFSPDRFSGLLESPGTYRKSGDDFGVTFAVSAARVKHIQPLMEKAGKLFVVFLVQVSGQEQADAMLAREIDPPADGQSLPSPDAADSSIVPEVVPVYILADLLDMTERNVQILADRGVVFRDSRGLYRLRESLRGVLREERKRADGRDTDYHRERTGKMAADRQLAEMEALERAGKLVNAEEVLRLIERAKSADRQRWLIMPKVLAPRLDGLTAKEQEPLLEEYAHSSLHQLASLDLSSIVKEEEPQQDPPRQKRERKKKEHPAP